MICTATSLGFAERALIAVDAIPGLLDIRALGMMYMVGCGVMVGWGEEYSGGFNMAKNLVAAMKESQIQPT